MANPTPSNPQPIVEPNFVDALARQMRQPLMIDQGGNPIVVHPEDMKVTEIAHLLPIPARRRGAPNFTDVTSFVIYVNSTKNDDSRIYVDPDYSTGKLSIVAVINDDGVNDQKAGWRDHRAVYVPRHSTEWVRWTGKNAKPMSQTEFAAFIEDNAEVFIGTAVEGVKFPTSGEMLQMALDFEAKQDTRFRSSVRLASGSYELNVVAKDDQATETKMTLFSRFALGLRPYLNEQAYRIEARLRYRAAGGELTFWYELVRPDLVIEDAVKGIIEKIKGAMSVPVLFGTSPIGRT